MVSHVRSYRRIATVGRVEVHKDLKQEEFDWPGTFLSFDDIRRWQDADSNTVVLLLKEHLPGGEQVVPFGVVGKWMKLRTVYNPPEDLLKAVLVAHVADRNANIHLVESLEPGRGKEIVKAFEKYAKSVGVESISLLSHPEAKPFWLRMGYIFPYRDDEGSKELND